MLVVAELKQIPLTDIYVNENDNCRNTITPLSVFDLAQDIKKNGLHEPVIVRITHPEDSTSRVKIDKPYILVAGFRRFVAHQVNAAETIEAVIRDMSPLDAMIVNLSENLIRKDLTLMEEANGIRRLIRVGLNRKEICEKLGKSAGWVQPRMYAVQMEPEIQRLAEEGVLTADNIRQLWSYKNSAERLAVAKQIRKRRERGFIGKVNIKDPKVPKRNKANIKKARDRSEINNLLDHLLDCSIPFGLHTRMLAWASGQITDMELCVDIQAFYNDLTKIYKIFIGIPDNPPGIIFNTQRDQAIQLLEKWGLKANVFYPVPPRGIPDMNDPLD